MTMGANAQGPGKKDKCLEGNRPGASPKMLLEKFDQDGDGKLDEAELSEIKKEMKKRREANKAKMLERFDTDKDGELSREEKKTALPTIIEERKEIHQAVLKEFDKDGDGSLSQEERKGAREWIQKNYPDAIHMPPHRGGRAGKGGLLHKKGPKANRQKPEAGNNE